MAKNAVDISAYDCAEAAEIRCALLAATNAMRNQYSHPRFT